MQTVPSLVGTGSAIAAAASGFVFAEAVEPAPATRPPSQSGLIAFDHEPTRNFRVNSPQSSRPGTEYGTTSTGVEKLQKSLPRTPEVSRPPLSRYQRPGSSQYSGQRAASRRQSFIRPGEPTVNTITETPRDSFSSNSSWIRRLSIRPLSQHESPRSSIGPDSGSIAFSHGSAAPILSPTYTLPATPNKLVKRTPSGTTEDTLSPARRRSRSHLPTLRRPATSHQRSATLQQFQTKLDLEKPTTPSNQSLEQETRQPAPGLLASPFQPERRPQERLGWVSFFHTRTFSTSGRSIGRITDISPQNRAVTQKRISLIGGGHHQRRAHLIKPAMMNTQQRLAQPMPEQSTEQEPEQAKEPQGEPLQQPSTSEQTTPSKALRRSISLTFSSAGNWVSRTSGSIRRPKRPDTSNGGTNRNVSDPVSSNQGINERRPSPSDRTNPPNTFSIRQGKRIALATTAQRSPRGEDLSSPLPPLSAVSSFHMDSRIASPVGATAQFGQRSNQPSGSSSSSAGMGQYRSRKERAVTMDGSEGETRDFMSGDDDDTDFKSDTMFDSIRTGASGRARAVETPVDSIYDESPPGTAGNGKAKRLSIQEILGKDWDGADKIAEEEESLSTPVRTEHWAPSFPGQDPINDSPFGVKMSSRARAGRLSMEDDFDDDWARNDDEVGNALSPPSKGSSANSRVINPNVRLALASISGNSHQDMGAAGSSSERPLSTLFDWSEPPVHDKPDGSGRSLRPRTAHANQESDARGGRSASRKGPTPAHVRSQSVPVVNEASNESKSSSSKYGTWGIGTKTISEDWDDDFEFGGSVASDRSHGHLFSVPESIRASQPSVKAHSGQIRELALLVNDLQRLYRRGKELNLIGGHHKSLWKEADGIITLASPDDDSLEGDDENGVSIDLDAFEANDRYFDDNFDSASMDKLDALLDGTEPVMSKTAVVRDRPSPQRRSVFSPDDDIFGGSWPSADDNVQSTRSSRPRTPESRLARPNDVNGVVRTVVEAMQQRSMADHLQEIVSGGKRVHFDTNSLKILVKRAGELRDRLSDIIRRADPITQSPVRTPRPERQLESSPAFTKVFDDPTSSPPRRIARRRGSAVDDATPDNSPSSGVNRRMQLMTVQ